MRRQSTPAFHRLVSVLLLVLGGALFVSACAGASPAASTGGQATGPTKAEEQPAKPAATAAPAATSAPAAQTGPECPVLTKQEIEAALGTQVLNADVLVTEGSLISCSYRDPKSPARMLVGVMVHLGGQAKLGFETRKSLATDPKPVEGIGDDAFWEEASDNIEVLEEDNAVVLTVYDEAASDRPKVAQDLAAKVLGRLAATSSSSASGTSSPASVQAATLDACSLLTKEEVEAVIGKTVNPVRTATSTDLFSCAYEDPEHKPQYFIAVTVFASTPSAAKGLHEATKGGGRDQVPITGLGDDAYWDETLGGDLYVLKGKYAASMSVSALDIEEPQEAAEALAPKLLARLP